MMNYTKSIPGVFDDCEVARQLDSVLLAKLSQLGFERVVYTSYASDYRASERLQHELVSEGLRKWFEYFWLEGYDGVDPIGQEIRCQLLPRAWSLQTLVDKVKGPTRKMIKEAIRFGLEQGVTIPVHGVQGEFALLVIYVDADPLTEVALAHKIQKAHLLLLDYHQKLQAFLLNKEVPPSLTAREQEILQLAALHQTANQMAETLCVTTRTVNFHLENINKKLSTHTKFQAVSKAIALGLIRS